MHFNSLECKKIGAFALSQAPEGTPSIKEVENLLRDPNGIAVRPSGFDCVRPCHPERSGAKSNCEAAPSKARWDLGRTPLKMTRRAIPAEKKKEYGRFVRTPFHTSCLFRLLCYTF